MAAGTKHYLKTGKEFKGAVHKMPGGKIHTGKAHTASSKPVVHFKNLSAAAKKVPKGSKAAGRRASFCARMGGVKGPMKDSKGRPTRKALALRKWKCGRKS